MSEYVWREVNCSRSVSGTSFPNGVQDFNFGVGAPTGFIPSKSYFKIDCEIKENGAAPDYTSMTALADMAPNSLYNNVSFQAGGRDISSIVSHVPQAGAVRNRLRRSGAWQKSTGKVAYGMEAEFQKRVEQVSTKGADVADYEVVRLGSAGNETTGTIAISAGGVVSGVNVQLLTAGLKIGDYLSVNGINYRITTAPNTDADGDTGARVPIPPAAVVASLVCHGLKKPDVGANRNNVSLMWQPPLGIFDYNDILGSGDYRVTLNPNADYQTACIESKSGRAVSLSITNVRLYVCTVKASIPSGLSELSLMEQQLYSKSITSGQTLDFTVPSSTNSIAVFVQQNTAGSNTLYPPTKFSVADDAERSLTQLQLTYNNVTKPSTNWSSAFSPTINQLQQRYFETQMESGMLHSEGGSESFEDWLARGCLYLFDFSKDENSRTTQLQLQATFSGNVSSANLFICAFYESKVEIATENGMVQNVRRLAV